jgi:WD40 repeat protein
MNRLLAAVGVCIAIAGCSASGPTNEPQPARASATHVVAATPGTQPSASAPVPAAGEPTAVGRLVAYESKGGVWVANTDGTGAHELLPNVADGEPLAWSANGSLLLYRRGLGFGLTDAAGSHPVEIDLPCPAPADADADLASCGADNQGASLSPDGTRLAYPIWEGRLVQGSPVMSSLVVMELETGRVTKVGSTETTISGTCGENRSPRWSPDGRRLAFVRTAGSDGSVDCGEALLTVTVDGSDARQIVAPGQVTGDLDANWSPDGSRIVIAGFAGDLSKERPFGGDIFSVRSDGADVRVLTSDRLSGSPSWTRDGRIVFTRWAGHASSDRGDLWVMDSDGGNATRLEATVAALTAAGCLICSYPVYGDGIDLLTVRQTPPLARFWITRMLWQP